MTFSSSLHSRHSSDACHAILPSIDSNSQSRLYNIFALLDLKIPNAKEQDSPHHSSACNLHPTATVLIYSIEFPQPFMALNWIQLIEYVCVPSNQQMFNVIALRLQLCHMLIVEATGIHILGLD